MSRNGAYYELRNESARRNAIDAISRAHLNSGVAVRLIKESKKAALNARMWALLSDVSRHVKWHGAKLKPEQWKALFVAYIRSSSMRYMPTLCGRGLIPVNLDSSSLNRDEMIWMIESITQFARSQGVKFRERGY